MGAVLNSIDFRRSFYGSKIFDAQYVLARSRLDGLNLRFKYIDVSYLGLLTAIKWLLFTAIPT